MKRILFIPQHYNVIPRPHQDWFDAFWKYFYCEYYSDSSISDISNNSASNFDFIFVQCGAIDPEKLLHLKNITGAKVIQWTGDCRSECMSVVTDNKDISDLTLLAVGIGQKDMYERELSHPVDYLQQGVFNSFFYLPKYLSEGKIVFIGNNYDHFEGAVERTELCRILSNTFDNFEVIGNGFNVDCFTNNRSIPYEESAKIYNDSYISISHACFNEIEGYYSNRTFDIMASGGCCLMRYTPNAERWFKDMEYCVFYKTNEEAIEKINFILANPSVRNEVALRGHKEAKDKHTFAYRVKEIYDLIQKYFPF